ncbi:MAG: hypothetical protein ABJA35_02240 [Parafilimonas sp.]
MTTLDIVLIYFGTVILALIFLYGLKNYWITGIAGFIAFCVFYFSFGVTDFNWEVNSILQLLKSAAIIYYISFVIAIIIYKLLPVKESSETTAQ